MMSRMFLNTVRPKIKVKSPLVDMSGDEMARVIWSLTKKKLILPYLDIDIKYFDLSLKSRDATSDQITIQAANAIQEFKLGVKCSTITPDALQQQALNHKDNWFDATSTISSSLNSTIISEPIIFRSIPRSIPSWKSPIILARPPSITRHDSKNFYLSQPGVLSLEFTPADGSSPSSLSLPSFSFPAVSFTSASPLSSFHHLAENCFSYSLSRGLPLYLTTKSTILKNFDGAIIEAFDEVFKKYEKRFEKLGLIYEHRLIDDMIAQVIKGEGGFIWACKSYDGEALSYFVAQGFGSIGLMSSTFFGSGCFLYGTAHGTVPRHYKLHQQGAETSTNPISTIFAWTKALHRRAVIDDTPLLIEFAMNLEKSVKQTVSSGKITRDLASMVYGKKLERKHWLTTEQFINEVSINFNTI